MKKITLVSLLLALLLAVLGQAAWAQESITPEPLPPPIDEPPILPPIWQMDGLEIPYQRVDVIIADQVATTHIEQLFRNPNDWILEGTYFFPLPEGAAVSELTMWVDGQPIEAKILEKEEARAIYDEIVRQLRDPALLEYVGTSAIQANVFPIPPGDERLIEIEYSHLLPADNGTIHYTYPQSADLYTNTPLDEQRIRVEVSSDEAIRAIYSPSHRVAIDRDSDFGVVVGYEDANVIPDQDFELYYTVSPEEIGLTLLSTQEPGEDGFFLLLVAPGVEVGEVVAKDVILVLDTSGSMEGEKIVQAKEAAVYVVDHLNEGDRFNLVTFSTGTSLYEPELLPATQPGNYEQFIDSLEAVGGTNISQALLEAAVLVDAERPTTILFLTDGLATEGIIETPLLLESVADAMPDNARLFSFGVGDDVDTTLLDTLAQDHRGTTTYVRPNQAIDEAVSSFYAKVGTPVLTDLLLDYDGIRVEQVYPAELPDLFAGSQLVVAGRYREGGPATITLHGTTNGREQLFTYPDQRFRDEAGEAFIPRLWATRAIGHLMQQIRLNGEDTELVQSIVNLSTRYGIITPYTSFLIEEDDILNQIGIEEPTEEPMEEAAEALAAPASVSGAAAVDRAATESEMMAADTQLVEVTRIVTEVVTEEGLVSQPLVQTVGNKTFFWRNGQWVDSTFDADGETLQAIPFASDAYFDLLNTQPESGQFLALGEQMILVLDGQAYQVTAEGGEQGSGGAEEQGRLETGRLETEEVEANPQSAITDPQSGGLPMCSAALILPLLLLAGVGIGGRHRKRKAD